MAQSISVRKLRPAALARELGVTRQGINELVRRGVVPTDERGLIDADLARGAILERLRPSAKTAQAAAAGRAPAVEAAVDAAAPVGAYHVARTLRETAEARLAQLTLAERQGKLLSKDAVEREVFQLCRVTRDGLQSVGPRVAGIVAGLASTADCQAVIDGEIRAALRLVVERLDAARPPLVAALAAELVHALEPLLARSGELDSLRAELSAVIDNALRAVLGP